jgi:hypothetical protein
LDLLEWACGLLRKGPPPKAGTATATAEHLWFIASIGLLERSGGSSPAPGGPLRLGTFAGSSTTASRTSDDSVSQMLEFHLEDAKARFPDEPRWTLVQGIAQDLRSWPDWRDDVALNVQPIPAASTTVAYEQALSRPEVRQEALVRLGEFELRLGLTAKALDFFRQAGTPNDPYVAYWLHLFAGNALEQSNRPTDAIAEYEAALESAPFALTATVALGSVLVTQHRATEASALVSRVLAIPPRPDPWSVYTFPDWRYFPDAMAELRRGVVR